MNNDFGLRMQSDTDNESGEAEFCFITDGRIIRGRVSFYAGNIVRRRLGSSFVKDSSASSKARCWRIETGSMAQKKTGSGIMTPANTGVRSMAVAPSACSGPAYRYAEFLVWQQLSTCLLYRLLFVSVFAPPC